MGFSINGPAIFIRSFVPIYKPFMYLSDDGTSLLGPIGEIFNKEVKKFPQINTTYVPYNEALAVFDVGKCMKNNCFGMTEMIRQKKADLWIIGAPLDAFDGETEGFSFGPATIEMSDMITSVAKVSDTVSVKLDLTTSLNTVNSDVYLNLLFVLIAFILISKLYNFTHSQLNNQKSESVFQILWNLISTGSMQSVFRANTFAQRVLLISFIVGFFIIVSHYHAHLNTNLVIKKAEKNIDTLSDLIKSNMLPFFLKYGPTTKRFVNSTNPLYKKIGSRASYITIRNLVTVERCVNLMVSYKAVFIGPTLLSSLHETLQCFFHESYGITGNLYFSKSQFNKILWIYFYSSQMDINKRLKLNLLAYMGIEFGIYNALARRVLRIIKTIFGNTSGGDCNTKTTMVQSSSVSIIQLHSLRYMLLFWLAGNVLAIAVLIIQLSFRRFLLKKPK